MIHGCLAWAAHERFSYAACSPNSFLSHPAWLPLASVQGIGFEIARELSRNGLTTVIAARRPELGQAAVDKIKESEGTPGLRAVSEAADGKATHPYGTAN